MASTPPRIEVMRRLVMAAAIVATGVALGARRKGSRRTTGSALSTEGRASRTAAVTGLSARLGTSWAFHRARRTFASAARREELDRSFELATADQVSAALGNMLWLAAVVTVVHVLAQPDYPTTTVFDPSLGFVTGGGSFAWPGSGERTTFGFTVKYKSNSRPEGNLVVIRHMADGSIYRLKSSAIAALAMGTGSATFSGKGVYIEPGWDTAKGNTSFTVYAEDGGATDKLWLQIVGGMSMPTPAAANAQTLTGGNITLPH